MTMPIKMGTCPHCSDVFDKLFAHQKFCSTYCAFWSRVDKREKQWVQSGDHQISVHAGDTNQCWLWTGSKNQFGYGELSYNGFPFRTHVLSYLLHYGSLGKNTHVLHHCDNPTCVRPTHLYAGNQNDNMNDARKRGRMLQKLTLEQVAEVEQRLRNGDVMLHMAKDFGVSCAAISARRQRMIREGRL